MAVDRRLSFDQAVESYDRARPSYPDSLFDEIFSYVRAALPDAQPLAVEIGPGTGQATRPLLERGAAVTAVEPGRRLAAFLSRNLAPAYPGQLDVTNAPFEEADLPDAHYDAVVAATSFHWLDQSVRLESCHNALRPGGALAIIGTNQIRSEADRGYFDRVQSIYQLYRPDDKRRELPGDDVVPPEYSEVEASGLFADAALHRYRWDQTYPSAVYADLLRSYSDTQMMEPAPRENMVRDLCAVIDSEYGGSIVRPLVVTLTLGRRRAE